MVRFTRPAWTSVGLLRAAAEGALAVAALELVQMLMTPGDALASQHPAWFLGLTYGGMLGGIVSVVRLRRGAGSPVATLGWEAAAWLAGLLVTLAVATLAAWLAIQVRPAVGDALPTTTSVEHPPLLAAFILGSIATTGYVFTYLVARPFVVLWPRWDRMRRTHIVWALTHGQLVASVLLAVLLSIVLLTALALGGSSPFLLDAADAATTDPVSTLLLTTIPTVLAGVVGTLLVAAFVLPAAALISWVVLRRTTRRLEGLAVATGSIQRGERGARVMVEGEDEVARLQADFNAMAADLDRAITELERERDNVASVLASRRELVSAVSHELRTPLATLRAHLDTATERWDQEPPPTLRDDLVVMRGEAVRLQRLIDDLFDLSRAEIGRLPFHVEVIDVAPLLSRSVEGVRTLAHREGRIELGLEIGEAIIRARADPDRLDQVVRNLLLNAIRHSPPGGLIRVAAIPPAPDTGVTISVEDTGSGIAPADLPRIWDRFYRADRERGPGGAGLGLALVKELTEAMGGSVAVESSLGRGSRFSVVLPAA